MCPYRVGHARPSGRKVAPVPVRELAPARGPGSRYRLYSESGSNADHVKECGEGGGDSETVEEDSEEPDEPNAEALSFMCEVDLVFEL